MTSDEFKVVVTTNVPHGTRILLLSDCCHSGTVVDFSAREWRGFQAISIVAWLDAETSDDAGRGGIFTNDMLTATESLCRRRQKCSVDALFKEIVQSDKQNFDSKIYLSVQTMNGTSCETSMWPLLPPSSYEAPSKPGGEHVQQGCRDLQAECEFVEKPQEACPDASASVQLFFTEVSSGAQKVQCLNNALEKSNEILKEELKGLNSKVAALKARHDIFFDEEHSQLVNNGVVGEDDSLVMVSPQAFRDLDCEQPAQRANVQRASMRVTFEAAFVAAEMLSASDLTLPTLLGKRGSETETLEEEARQTLDHGPKWRELRMRTGVTPGVVKERRAFYERSQEVAAIVDGKASAPEPDAPLDTAGAASAVAADEFADGEFLASREVRLEAEASATEARLEAVAAAAADMKFKAEAVTGDFQTWPRLWSQDRRENLR